MLEPLQRNILVANRIAVILGVLALLLLVILLTVFGPNINSPLIAGISIFFFSIVFLNNKGFHNTGRVLLCCIPPVFTLYAAILAKVYEPGFTDILYYDSRFFIVMFCIAPCMIFDTTEVRMLYGCLLVILATLLFFDPVHEYFGVGYFQKNFSSSSYYYINYVAFIAFTGISAGAISLKKVIEKTEVENEKFRQELLKVNQQLGAAFNDLEAQHEEIIAQSEELYASQEKLLEANRLIEIQKAELQKKVHEVNSELADSNEELIKHNNELRQFSYTISHNLRGPIARLLGLANLVHLTGKFDADEEARAIVNHIQSSALELDNVIRDLSAIVDIRNSVHQVRQEIDFNKEWKEIKKLLNIGDDGTSMNFKVDFSEAPTMISVRPMINSILYNLVSNAIKYKSDIREPLIALCTRKNGEYTVIEVSDNGLGIDLNAVQNDMFKMYKRFHHHQEGKGLGLYLVKLQTESLNGFVEVTSEIEQGTCFRVHIRNPISIEDDSVM